VNLTTILADLDAEIARLQQAKALLSGTVEKRKPGRPPLTAKAPVKKRNLSPEGRARIAAAAKARWARQKKGTK
jgi:hypothetical protein